MTSKFIRQLERGLTAVAMTGFIVMLVATVSQVLFRYVLMISVPWTEELARILFVTSMFLGIALAALRGEHIVVDFLLKGFPPRVALALQVAFGLATLAFLLALGRGAVAMAQATWGTHFVALTWFRLGYVYVAEVVGVAFTVLFIGLQTAAMVRSLAAAKAAAHSESP